jgi:hypothetical protein
MLLWHFSTMILLFLTFAFSLFVPRSVPKAPAPVPVDLETLASLIEDSETVVVAAGRQRDGFLHSALLTAQIL